MVTTYCLLVFRNVTYFPLTWRFAVDEFGWNYDYKELTGLTIRSVPGYTTPAQLPPTDQNIASVIYYDEYPSIPKLESFGQGLLSATYTQGGNFSLHSYNNVYMLYSYSCIGYNDNALAIIEKYSRYLQGLNWTLLYSEKQNSGVNDVEYYLKSPDNGFFILVYTFTNNIHVQITRYTPTIKTYTSNPMIPDYGALSGAQLLISTNDNDGNYVYLYDSSSISFDILLSYYRLLEAFGFESTVDALDWAGNGSSNLFFDHGKKSMVMVGVDNNGYFSIGIGSLNGTIPPPPTHQDKMYAEYPSVPDFGSFSGAKLMQKLSTSPGYLAYLYELSFDPDYIVQYGELLKQHSFVYSYSFLSSENRWILIYSKENLTVSIGIVVDTFTVSIGNN